MTRQELDKYRIPDEPGVYMFFGRNPVRTGGRKRPTSNMARILYIGKATSLRDRVRSYFSTNLGDARSGAIVAMIEEARSISWKETDSILEALILEANLIKQHQPRYNTDEKDDKSYNYLVITKEEYPRVLIVRGRELFSPLFAKRYSLAATFGPFPHGLQLREAIKIVRKIFPFRDKCTPCDIPNETLLSNSHELDNKKMQKGYGKDCRPCFNRQIGLCPGVCTGEINKKDYAKIVRHITILFSGKLKKLKSGLEREMRTEAKAERYENARELRRQIGALEHIRDVSLIKAESNISPRRIHLSANSRELADSGLFNISDSSHSVSPGANTRVEAYDVAHTSGTETVAVMTVLNNGEPEKESYRKFKIKTAKNDDVGALKEVLSRRLAHNEWPLPRVFVVDGSTAQLRAAARVLRDVGVFIPVVGVVKNEFHKPERILGNAKVIETRGNEILLANQEAHRFAIAYHRIRRRKQTLLR